MHQRRSLMHNINKIPDLNYFKEVPLQIFNATDLLLTLETATQIIEGK